MGETSITYEELFEILRQERNSEELQVLNDNFYSSIIRYFDEKQKVIDDKSEGAEMFGASEKGKVVSQLENAKKIVKELIERREKKIIILALNKARTNSDIIDTSSLLDVEKEFFYQSSALFASYKTGVMERIVSLKNPVFGDSENAKETKDVEVTAESSDEKEEETTEPEVKEEVEEVKEGSEEPAETSVKVKFKSSIPKFLGRDEKTYGPFEEEETAEIAPEIAEILISKGRAERV